MHLQKLKFSKCHWLSLPSEVSFLSVIDIQFVEELIEYPFDGRVRSSAVRAYRVERRVRGTTGLWGRIIYWLELP